MNEIDKRIECLRKERNISQTELAKKLGISRSAVNAWEMGVSKPHIEHVIAMSRIFNVTTDFLLDMDNAKYIIDISDLPNNERKIVVDLASALRKRV